MFKKFNQMYVGYQNRTNEGYLGFMTPYVDDSFKGEYNKFLNRKSTVDNWAHRSNIQSKIYDNKPSTNFTIERTVSRWSTSNKMWRVYDPRGFYLEIDSYNLDYLIQNFDIVDGKFQGNLIWVRNGKNNYLIGYETKEYENAVDFITTKDTYIKENTVGYGDKIKLAGGDIVIYLGRFHTVSANGYHHITLNISSKLNSYYINGNSLNSRDCVSSKSKLNIIEVIEKGNGKVTVEELNEKYKTDRFQFRNVKNKSFKFDMQKDENGRYIKSDNCYLVKNSRWEGSNYYKLYTLDDNEVNYQSTHDYYTVNSSDRYTLRIIND